MSYSTAKSAFDAAQLISEDEAIQKLAEGLRELTRAIESDLIEVKRSVDTVRKRA